MRKKDSFGCHPGACLPRRRPRAGRGHRDPCCRARRCFWMAGYRGQARTSPGMTATCVVVRGHPCLAFITVGAAQLGPIQRADSRAGVVARMLELLRQAAEPRLPSRRLPRAGAHHVLPALVDDRPGGDRQLLRARDAVATRRRRCSTRRSGSASASIWALPSSSDAARGAPLQHVDPGRPLRQDRRPYRKIHLPGHAEHEPWRAFQHLEKRYFEVGDLGLGVWRSMGANIGMCICNDRRWPETYRVMGLQDVEMVAARLQHAAPQSAGARPRPL